MSVLEGAALLFRPQSSFAVRRFIPRTIHLPDLQSLPLLLEDKGWAGEELRVRNCSLARAWGGVGDEQGRDTDMPGEGRGGEEGDQHRRGPEPQGGRNSCCRGTDLGSQRACPTPLAA